MFKYKEGEKFKTEVPKDIYTVRTRSKRSEILEQAINDNVEKHLPPVDEDNDNIYLCYRVINGRHGWKYFSEKDIDDLEKME